jgi:KaiC/GvpD/RAD55 family RecA-like ATPase
VDHQSRAELENLLVSLLTEADVRRIVRLLPGGEDMHADLPGTSVSLKELVHQAVSVLARHGRLDGVFFEAVVAERPARRDQIRALAARMPGPTTATPPAPTASPGVMQLATAEARLRYVAAIEQAAATRRTLTALTASASASGGVVSLDDVYLPPHLHVTAASADASAFDLTAASGDLERAGGALQDWLRVLSRKRKLVTVIGEMGRGKTELMHHVRCELARMAKEDPAAPLPILVSARELGAGLADRQDLARAAGKQLALQADNLRTLLADPSTRWIYLIDSLEEAAPTIRETVLALANNPEWRAARVIVTSRPSAVSLDASQIRLLLPPWNSEQVDRFLDRWKAFDAATVEVLRASPHYQNASSAFLANPLMATLCLALVKQKGRLPPSRAALFMDLIDILFQGWARERVGDAIKWQDVAPALEQVALQHVRERHPHVTRDRLSKALHAVNRHAALELEHAFEHCFGVLVRLEDGSGYEFLFRGLAEHLAGAAFLDAFLKNGFEPVRNAVHAPWAEEVVRHAIGISMEGGQREQGLALLRGLLPDGWPWRESADLWLRPLLIAIRTAADIQKPTAPWAEELARVTLAGLLDEESHWVGERVADALQVLAAAGGPITKLLWKHCYERLMEPQQTPDAWYVTQGERDAAWWLRALRHREANVRAVACERLAAHVDDHEVREQLLLMLFDGWGLGVAPALVAGGTLRKATRDAHFVKSIRDALVDILEGGGQFSAGGAALALLPNEAEPRLLARALAAAYQGTREILAEPVHALTAAPGGKEALAAEWPQWREGLVETWRYRSWIPEPRDTGRPSQYPPLSQHVRRRIVRAFATGLTHLDAGEWIAAQAKHRDSSINELCRAAFHRPGEVLPLLALNAYHGTIIPVDAQRNLGRAAIRHREVRDALLAAWHQNSQARQAIGTYPGVALERLVLDGDEEAIDVYAAWLPVSPYTWPYDFPRPDPAVFTIARIKEAAIAEARYVWDYATNGQVRDGELSWLAPQTTGIDLHHRSPAWIEDAALVSGLCRWLDGQDEQKRIAAAWAFVGGPVPAHVRPQLERVLVELMRGHMDSPRGSAHDVKRCLRIAERLGIEECVQCSRPWPVWARLRAPLPPRCSYPT